MTNEQVLGQPEEVYEEDFYSFSWPEQYIRIELERFAEARDDDVRVEATVVSTDPLHGGEPVTLKTGARLLLTGPNSRRDLARALADENPQFPWARMLEQVCGLALKRYRRGSPGVDLWEVKSEDALRFLMRPLVPDNAVTIWYGAGGEAKSLLALAHMCAIAFNGNVAGVFPETTGKGMYLDWEDDDQTHAERLRAILKGNDMTGGRGRIIYKRMTTTLADSARDLRKEILRDGIRFAVVDSVGMAAGGDPSDANAIIRCMTACRQLGVPVVAIHHLAKPQDGKKVNKDTPYGSIYAVNEARSTWLVERDEDSSGSTLRVAMTNKKSNRSQLNPRQAFTIDFVEDEDERLVEVRFRRLPFLQSANIGKTDRKWRILQLLKDSDPMTVPEIAEALGMTDENVRDGIKSAGDMFVEFPNKDGRAKRWGVRREDGEVPVSAEPETVQEATALGEPTESSGEPTESSGDADLDPF